MGHAQDTGILLDSTTFKSETRYQPPSVGVFAFFSERWRPYAELARLDKPGFALLWIVHLCGILLASILDPRPVDNVLKLAAFFLFACQVLMWLNFAWNDTCDVKFDRQVFRTRHRPLARNALTLPQAVVFDGLLACMLAAFLLPLPASCFIYAIPLAFGCFVYPLTKRFTNHPQACLGVILAGGLYMGAAAAGVDGLPYPTKVGDILAPRLWWYPSSDVMLALGSQYLTLVFWVISTETVYSYQDAEWDEAAGVGTITRLIPNHRSAKVLLFLMAGIQVTLFASIGVVLGFQPTFWRLSVGSTFAALVFTISSVDLKSPESCLFWFQAGNMVTGIAMLFGYGAEYFSRARVL